MANEKPRWTEEQLAVIKDESRTTVCIAAAGSGKTQVMTARYRFLVERKNVNPSRVLCCSFGNAGVDAIRDRCAKVPGSDASMFSTIHRLGLSLLKSFPEYAGRGVRILSGDELLNRIDLTGNGTLRPSDLAGYIQEARERGIHPGSTQDEIGAFCALHDRLRGREGLFSRAFSSYMERLSELHSEGFVDMADLIILPVTRLDADPVLRSKASSMFDAILVDEYQDTDMMQQKLLDLIRRKDTWFTVMGDDDQSIYTWRGANPDMIRMIADRENVKAKTLSVNFRCTAETISAAECFVEGSPGRTEKVLKAAPDAKGEAPDLTMSDGFDAELDDIVMLMKEATKDGVYGNRVAFLARTNSMVSAVKERLKKEGIPVSETPDRRAVTGKISVLLSWIEGRSSSAALMGMIGGDCAKAVEDLASSGVSGVEEEDRWLRENSTGIAADVAALTRPSDLGEAIVMGVKIGCFEESEKDLLRKIYAQIRKAPSAKMTDILNDMVLSASEPEGEDMTEGVTVTTIHKAKGLQYENVILDMTSGIFPRSGTGITPEEERLAYVAFTRASKKLHIVADRRKGLSSLLIYRMDPRRIKAGGKEMAMGPREIGSGYRKPEKAGVMHGMISLPDAWTQVPAGIARTDRGSLAARESEPKRKTASSLLSGRGKE